MAIGVSVYGWDFQEEFECVGDEAKFCDGNWGYKY